MTPRLHRMRWLLFLKVETPKKSQFTVKSKPDGTEEALSVSVREFHKSRLRSARVSLPVSLPENKVGVFFPFFLFLSSPRRKLSVLIKVSDTTVQAEAPVHTACPRDYTLFPFLEHVTG